MSREKKILSLRWLFGHCKELHSFSKCRPSQRHNSKAEARLSSLPPTDFPAYAIHVQPISSKLLTIYLKTTGNTIHLLSSSSSHTLSSVHSL